MCPCRLEESRGQDDVSTVVSNLLECAFMDQTLDSTPRSQTDIIYLDFRKTFDTVSHNKLLYKLSKDGITCIEGQHLVG